MAIHLSHHDEIALITLDRPEGLNALSFGMIALAAVFLPAPPALAFARPALPGSDPKTGNPALRSRGAGRRRSHRVAEPDQLLAAEEHGQALRPELRVQQGKVTEPFDGRRVTRHDLLPEFKQLSDRVGPELRLADRSRAAGAGHSRSPTAGVPVDPARSWQSRSQPSGGWVPGCGR